MVSSCSHFTIEPIFSLVCVHTIGFIVLSFWTLLTLLLLNYKSHAILHFLSLEGGFSLLIFAYYLVLICEQYLSYVLSDSIISDTCSCLLITFLLVP